MSAHPVSGSSIKMCIRDRPHAERGPSIQATGADVQSHINDNFSLEIFALSVRGLITLPTYNGEK